MSLHGLAVALCQLGCHARHLVPCHEPRGKNFAIVLGRQPVSAGTKVLPDWPERFEEALGLLGRLKAAHRPFSLARWLMRVLGPIVQPLVLAVLGAGQHRLEGWSVAGELVGDRNTGLVRVRFHDPLQERLGGLLIPPLWTRISSTIPAASTARHK